ncbi:MAG TPA: Holliday junction resolvase RuvX [Planctomycetota bacterium]
MGGVLAIDYGTRKCGFASTDALRLAREPGQVLRHEGREELVLEHVARLLAERDVATVVVGLPLDPQGRPGPAAERAQAFVARLRERFPALAVEVLDERLTTKEAEARLRALGRSGREIRAERDAWSALVLLEDWLSTH